MRDGLDEDETVVDSPVDAYVVFTDAEVMDEDVAAAAGAGCRTCDTLSRVDSAWRRIIGLTVALAGAMLTSGRTQNSHLASSCIDSAED